MDEVTEAMPRVFKRPYNTPQKLKASLQKKGLKAVLLATKCGECKAVMLHMSTDQDLYYYKNYELWNIHWGDDAECPMCGGYDSLFAQHHTCRVVFDTSGMPDIKYSLGNITALKLHSSER